jgi:hypothetical protein
MGKSNEDNCDNDELEEIGTDDPVQTTVTIPIEDTRPIKSFGPRRKLEAAIGFSSIIAEADFNPEGQDICSNNPNNNRSEKKTIDNSRDSHAALLQRINDTYKVK